MSTVRKRTKRIVEGALLSCIHDHGPITEEFLASATKRIVSQLESAAANGAAVISDEDALSALEALHKRLGKLRHGHEILRVQYDRCRAERDNLRLLLAESVSAG